MKSHCIATSVTKYIYSVETVIKTTLRWSQQFSQKDMRKYSDNIFLGNAASNRFQVHFHAQSQVRIEGIVKCNTTILRASEQLRWLEVFIHYKENTIILYRNLVNRKKVKYFNS
jgi:hypothetical protein